MLLSFSRQVKDILGDKLTKIILYGSYARGDYRDNSDIDIMILTTLTDEEIAKAEKAVFNIAFDFQMEYGVDISVIIKNEEHFNYWLGALPFYDNVQRVLAYGTIDFKRHKDVIGYFNKEYVATGVFPRELGRRLGTLKQYREKSDYDDFYIASKEIAIEQIETANLVLDKVKEYLKNK